MDEVNVRSPLRGASFRAGTFSCRGGWQVGGRGRPPAIRISRPGDVIRGRPVQTPLVDLGFVMVGREPIGTSGVAVLRGAGRHARIEVQAI